MVVFALIAILTIYEATRPPGPSASWSVSVQAVKVLPNDYVRVFFAVDNTGTAAGSPDCSIIIQPVDSFGDDLSGDGLGTLQMVNNVPAGTTVHTYTDIVVSHNDARFVTKPSMVSVSDC